MKLELSKTNRQNIEDIYPLSPMQEGMLFESLYAPNSGVYFEQIICTFTGNLNVEVFLAAWQQVVARHSIFRTAFVWESLSKPVQVVYRQVQVSVNTIDWRELSNVEQSAQLEAFLDSERQQGLQLSQAPLMRLHLLQISENSYQFIWSVHHILLDGWSFPLVFQDLFAFYQAISDGTSLALQPTISYRNYIAWLQQQDQDLAKEFWRQKLHSFSTPTPLTVDQPFSNRDPHSSSYHEQLIQLTLSATAAVQSFVRQHQLTMNNLVQATWGLLLCRYSSETDVVFGVTVSGRPPSLIGVESMVGLFINTVPVRLRISENTKLLELLKDLQAQQVESEQFSYSSLIDIQGFSNVPRGTSLFESIVVFENYPVDTAVVEDNGSFTLSNFRGIEQTNYPLTVVAVPGEQLSLKVSYDTSRFDHATISRMLEHFVTMMTAIVTNPQQNISALPLLTASEEQQLLVEWNDTTVDYPQDKCIPDLFEEQVARTPDAVAVVFEDQQLTYGELNARANQLADYLRSLGVSADVLVGICVERSLSMVVGLLGILKAGGAYVPLDPDYPQERLRFMLEDAQARVLLTQQSLVDRLREQTTQLVCLDTDWQLISQSSQDNHITAVQATNLAYVIYTSGSTGQPKGVEVIHRGVNRLVFGVNYVKLDATQRFLHLAPISFDASTFEIWGALLHGGLCVIFRESIPTAKNLGDEIDKHDITVLWLTAALFNSIIDENSQALSGIRQLLIGGEALSVAHVQKALSRLPLTQIINGYGPTESTTFTCCHPLPRQLERTIESILIGRPIANTQVYILDSDLQPVPIGVPGELHIGGAGLARGYLNRPDLTVEKFIDNPFDNSKVNCPKSKLYKTGDKARYLPSGNIEYLGRIDFQVKIRGFRIELGEIEAVLSQHSNVQSVVVIARVDTPGNKRLVAYIVPHPQETPTVSELRQFLKSKLPDYMVPSAIVFLESLPLTPNGKVDHRALPTPDIHSEFQDKYVAPRTPTEEMLVLIWAQVLKVEHVGIYDNFFSLGGHSLLATQLVSRIRNIFKFELPLRSLFATPTVAELALSIQQLQLENVKLTYTPILPRALNAELPLSFAQQRLWFLDQLEPLSASYNIPMALRLVGNLNVRALEQSLIEIIDRHSALRTNFIAIDGKARQIIHDSTNWTVSIVDLQHLSTSFQEIAESLLVQQQAIEPFDMSCSVLLRATLVVLSGTEHVLNVCMHHIVSDGWSMGVFVEELAALYNAYSQGQPSPLVPLPIQYADFAIWQRQWLAGVVLQSQLNYWLKQLANAPSFLPLPTDRPRGAVQTFAGAYLEFALSVELTQRLTKLSQDQGVTLFMTLLAGFNTLLYRYTGQTDILVGSPIANRHHREIESLIGFFVNTLVLHTDLSGDPSFNELLLRTRSMALDAYAHQDLPFEMLVEALQPERDLSHTPLFQVMFVLQNAPMSDVELTGLTVSSLPIETATAKFDITLSMKNTHTGLVGGWEYNTDLFERSTIEQMASHFRTLLEAIVANPTERISQLPLLTASESQQLLVEWNDTTVDYPFDKCIHQLFEEQVDLTPDAVAVVFQEQQLTYHQLNSRANQLAHYLQALGVRADVLVGICVQRSLEMVVGLLGILKAGGAYVPLDPEYPQDRLSFMIEDAQVSVLLTQQQLVEKLQQHHFQQVCLDTDWQLLTQLSQDNLICEVQGNNLGYVIYTSGSTGQPKGVAMSQLALCNLIDWQLENLKVSRGAKTLQFAPISFDASFHEMFSTWSSGGTLLLITEELRRDPVALLALMEDKAVERLFIPFVGLQQLAEVAVERESVTSTLREIITAGEQLQMTPAICNWLTQLSECTLHNHYGPSESHVVTTFTLSYSANSWPLLPPIGRPIANTQIYILDQYLQPVPIGVPGELYIGGVSLARAYFNRPDLTVEKFIPNLFSRSRGEVPLLSTRGERLYKTGDLARYLSSGNIEYLGRIDNQVKIRGFRIELGEIEVVLSQHSHVQASCVIAREDTTGDKRLVAYIVPQPEQTPTVSELLRFFKEKLPEYMVPSAIVILESLPLTPNGKVDRRALRAPEPSRESDKFVAPRTPTEEMLALIWAQVLKVELVGRHDNFFELGGHSLLATQLISRVRSSLVVELPLRSLFAAPTIAELSPLIQRLQQHSLEQTAPPILPRDLNTKLPLSFAQQRLWFLDQLEPLSASYNIPMALSLVGNLNVYALEQSLIEIIHRHSALRTNFITVDGQARQIIHDSTNWTVSIVDLQHLSTSFQEIAESLLAQQQAIQPFDLSCDALLRATLVVLSETEHVLNMCMHHVISDGWSMGVFVEELAALYNAYSIGKPSPLVPLPIQYADFAIWQRQWLAGVVLQSQLNYWLKQLANAPSFLPLPTDRPRGAVQTFAGAYLEFALSVELTQRLTKLSQDQGVTLFMTLLAGFNTLLYRYTGQTDILVGSPIANRHHREIESLIGFFVNTLVLHTDLSGDPSFNELLLRTRSMALDAYAHQDLPFEMLVEALQPERDLSHTPLFQVMFVLQNAPMSDVELTGLTVSSLPIETATAKFDITLSMKNTHTGLFGRWEYNTDLFDSSTIERMMSHFVTLLTAIVTNPQQKISALPLLTASEQQQLLVEWNDTQAEYPQDKCIHHLFEEQVARTPNAVAVVYENQQLTYDELNAKANQLAHYLQSLGVRADVLVGICVERSLDMVVGLLGILKAGGAYVPIDADYPVERKGFIIADTQTPILLTQQHLAQNFPTDGIKIICLDTDWKANTQQQIHNLVSETNALHLAYVIYTSGSTGKPKGTLITHQGLVNYLSWCIQAYEVKLGAGTIVHSSLGFDLTITSLFSPLLVGNQVEILPDDQGVETLSNSLRHHSNLSLVKITPAHLELLNQQISSLEAANRTRAFIIGGENLLAENIAFCLEFAPETKLVNEYGPTETVVGCCIYQVPTGQHLSGSIPIGRPISNTQIYILDSYLQPVPIGVPGELHIGGAGLARGYLNRPDLTVEKFIPNPFNNSLFKIHSSKLYKTGDLARYLPSGNIEYLGRIDNQVKIRGFRIELGEIEVVLSQHSHVQASCVIAREDTTGDKRLVAYIVPQPEQTPTVSELLRFFKEKLPEYMVPSAIVILESLPLTPNGKVDRRALRAPEPSRESDKFVAPRTPTEEMLALIWAQVLKVELVGRHDNFFELGGHSLLATQLISRVRSSLVVELPLRSLFAAPTIAELSPLIQRLQQHSLEQTAPPILPRDLNTKLPLSFAQQRLWFLDQLEPLSASYNIPMALSLVGNLNVYALEQSLIEIIHRHSALRTNFITVDGQARQIIHDSTNWTVSIVDLQHLSTSFQEIAESLLAQQQAIQPFDLSCDALLRATLVVLSETEHVLNMCMHHVISDGWSMGVFVEELAALYNAYSIGKPSPLVPLPIQYADFAIWQRQWLAGVVLQSQLNYWLKQLANAPSFLPLPTDRPRGAVQTFAGAYLEFALSVELTQKLTKLSQDQGVTLFMTLLAGFNILLYRYTGQTDILVGSPIANRHHREIESLIGFFVNTLVLHTDLSGDPSFNELLLRTRSMALDAYAHQDLPFEMLVEALQPERDLSHTPLFQVMFVLQNAPMSDVELTGLTVSSLPIETATTKFDLTLSMENTHTGLFGRWEYNTDLFDSSTIERMMSHFVTLLTAIVTNPQQKISALPLLTASEQQQLLVEWNDTQAEYPQDKCIHHLFEEQVARTPNAVAVVYENQQLTYDELNRHANQLAHYLRSIGVGADVLVGICVEPSLSMVVGLLGILKAGGAYVPLDPEYPIERLRFMLEDAQVSVLLTQQHLVEKLPLHQARVVYLDSDWAKIAQNSESNPLNGTTPSNLAYVIYTSGSTGLPKGVLVNHNNVTRLFAATEACYDFNAQDVWTLFHSIAFDFSVWEIWGAFLYGGRLIIVTYLVTRSPESFYELLCQEKVTILNQTPSAFRQLILAEQSIATVGNLNLRVVIFGGESLEINSLQPWFERHGDQSPQLVNMYGITETTVHVTIRPLSKDDLNSTVNVIGRPIGDLQVYVLDEHLQPVPIGVPGQMYVGGAGVSRGYLNRPELTAERLISNPFQTSRGGERLYKTGDQARYLPSGELEYLGRIDFQVKIRGFRIELGEIEAVLSQHEHVQASCVIAREDTTGDQRLVAYIVPQLEQTPTVSVLRQFLKEKLPDYMVPSAIVILESLPLTPNGKIDRHALIVPFNFSGSDTFVSPRNTVELQLVQIWSKILKIDNVGVKDNFFDLGGHSLLAPYLMAQIKQQFGKDIPLAILFQHPTIEDLVSIVQKDPDASGWSPLVAIQPIGSKPPLFCIPGAGGFPFYFYNLARCLGLDQPFYSFQVQDRDGELVAISKVEDIAAHYIQAMQAVQPQGPYFLGGHSFGGKVAFEMAQQLLRQGQVVALVAILDTTAPTVHRKLIELDDATWLIDIAKSMQIAFAKDLEMDADPLKSLALNEQLKYVLEYLHMLDLLPPDTDTTYLKHLLQAYKIHNNAEYVPQQVNPIPITLFRSSDSISGEPIVLTSELLQDVSWGWSAFSIEPVDIQFVPGNHVSMMTQPHVQVLAERLNACIKQRTTLYAVD